MDRRTVRPVLGTSAEGPRLWGGGLPGPRPRRFPGGAHLPDHGPGGAQRRWEWRSGEARADESTASSPHREPGTTAPRGVGLFQKDRPRPSLGGSELAVDKPGGLPARDVREPFGAAVGWRGSPRAQLVPLSTLDVPSGRVSCTEAKTHAHTDTHTHIKFAPRPLGRAPALCWGPTPEDGPHHALLRGRSWLATRRALGVLYPQNPCALGSSSSSRRSRADIP